MTTSVSALVQGLLLCYIMPVLGAFRISTCIELFLKKKKTVEETKYSVGSPPKSRVHHP